MSRSKGLEQEHQYEQEQEDGKSDQQVKAMVHNIANAICIVFPFSPGYNDLCSSPQAHAQHEHRHIKQPCNGSSSESHLAYPAQKCRVCDIDKVLCQRAQDDGVGDPPYFRVGVAQ